MVVFACWATVHYPDLKSGTWCVQNNLWKNKSIGPAYESSTFPPNPQTRDKSHHHHPCCPSPKWWSAVLRADFAWTLQQFSTHLCQHEDTEKLLPMWTLSCQLTSCKCTLSSEWITLDHSKSVKFWRSLQKALTHENHTHLKEDTVSRQSCIGLVKVHSFARVEE